jgi:hypothetical protein
MVDFSLKETLSHILGLQVLLCVSNLEFLLGKDSSETGMAIYC